MNGFDFLNKIKEVTQRSIPTLIISARDADEDIIKGLKLGADDFITKPFDPSELVARVKAHLSRFDRLVSKVEKDEDVIDIDNQDHQINLHQVLFHSLVHKNLLQL